MMAVELGFEFGMNPYYVRGGGIPYIGLVYGTDLLLGGKGLSHIATFLTCVWHCHPKTHHVVPSRGCQERGWH